MIKNHLVNLSVDIWKLIKHLFEYGFVIFECTDICDCFESLLDINLLKNNIMI